MTMRIAIFNNKGGVGKTTYLYHVAHRLADNGNSVLMVDCDSQCNLTAYTLSDVTIQKSWGKEGNSIFRQIAPVEEGSGDIRNRKPTEARASNGNLHIIPGDLNLSGFEDLLGDTWNASKGGAVRDLRIQSAIHRVIKNAAEHVEADYVFVDLGPNLGALNRAVLASCDYFVTPVAPDLFSIQGTKNLGRKLVTWRKEWDQCNDAFDGNFSIPNGRPKYLGYVVQQHNVRNNSSGMTKGWAMYGDKLESEIENNIIVPLSERDQVQDWDGGKYELGKIPHFNTLIAYSQAARKPIYKCTSQDGLTGNHIYRARATKAQYDEIVGVFEDLKFY